MKEYLFVHGLKQDTRNGVLIDLKVTVNNNSEIPKVYRVDKKP